MQVKHKKKMSCQTIGLKNMLNTDIVAVLFYSGYLVTNRQEIIKRLEQGQPFELITRGRMMFMSACDLGSIWERLANAPTIFTQDQLDTLK